jgi:hypothetical protein
VQRCFAAAFAHTENRGGDSKKTPMFWREFFS